MSKMEKPHCTIDQGKRDSNYCIKTSSYHPVKNCLSKHTLMALGKSVSAGSPNESHLLKCILYIRQPDRKCRVWFTGCHPTSNYLC